MYDDVERIVRKLVEAEEERMREGKKLRRELEDLISVANKTEYSGSVGAVDGGLLEEKYGGLVFVLVRALGAVFHYEESFLSEVEYVPSPNPPVGAASNVGIDMEPEDYGPFTSLVRLSSELKRAHEVVRRSVDYLFLDGSLVPQMVDKPRGESLMPLYEEVVGLFKSLYREEPLVVGVVKDTRGRRLSNFLREEGVKVPGGSDVMWLSYVLREGEYTAPVPYSDNPEDHPTLIDLMPHSKHVYVMYIRLSESDRPVRVEFYSKNPKRDAGKIAEVLYSLTPRTSYSIPPFLVEVDMRARLGRETMNFVKSYIERVFVSRYPHVRLFDRRPF